MPSCSNFRRCGSSSQRRQPTTFTPRQPSSKVPSPGLPGGTNEPCTETGCPDVGSGDYQVDNVIFHRETVWLRGPYSSEGNGDLLESQGPSGQTNVGVNIAITVV